MENIRAPEAWETSRVDQEKAELQPEFDAILADGIVTDEERELGKALLTVSAGELRDDLGEDRPMAIEDGKLIGIVDQNLQGFADSIGVDVTEVNSGDAVDVAEAEAFLSERDAGAAPVEEAAAPPPEGAPSLTLDRDGDGEVTLDEVIANIGDFVDYLSGRADADT